MLPLNQAGAPSAANSSCPCLSACAAPLSSDTPALAEVCGHAGDGLDYLLMEAMNDSEEGSGPGLFQQLSTTMGSVQRFMKSLSN